MKEEFYNLDFSFYFVGVEFPNFTKKRKTSKFSTLENFWHRRIVLKFGLRNPNLGGLFRGFALR